MKTKAKKAENQGKKAENDERSQLRQEYFDTVRKIRDLEAEQAESEKS